MKFKILVIAIIICMLLISTLIISLILLNNTKKMVVSEVEPKVTTEKVEKVEEPLVVFLDKKEEPKQNEEEQIHVKTPAELTQEIYNINGPIGKLNIPKTGLNTEVYSKVNTDKMEEMPCFLYTTGGLNEVGTTIFVGHNKGNEKLFSNNKMLEENDYFYFTDINGNETKYIIYSKFVTKNNDISFYNAQVESPVIAMQCCLSPKDEENVLIIMAKAEK